MDYLFRLPGGRSFPVRSLGNLPVELVAMLAGVKPATHCSFRETENAYVDRLCRAFALKRVELAPGPDSAPGWREVMLGRGIAPARAAARVWSREAENPGVALGYPACCVRRYVAWIKDKGPDGAAHCDIVRRIRRFSPPRGPWPFLLNNVFYGYSRRTADQERHRRLEKANPGLDLAALNLVPWHSCSYRCPRSLAKARAIWSAMRRLVPEHAARLAACLSKPVVFWDWDRFAVLEGVAKGSSVRYRGLRPPVSELARGDARLLGSGDLVRASAEELAVFAGSRRLGKLSGRPLLLPFGPAA
ncbi:MAG: hypothetical protein HY077_00755 [Elusimicrobia bacterium]|nr:hypothetical protein [Elusimicrobiota bacterium]